MDKCANPGGGEGRAALGAGDSAADSAADTAARAGAAGQVRTEAHTGQPSAQQPPAQPSRSSSMLQFVPQVLLQLLQTQPPTSAEPQQRATQQAARVTVQQLVPAGQLGLQRAEKSGQPSDAAQQQRWQRGAVEQADKSGGGPFETPALSLDSGEVVAQQRLQLAWQAPQPQIVSSEKAEEEQVPQGAAEQQQPQRGGAGQQKRGEDPLPPGGGGSGGRRCLQCGSSDKKGPQWHSHPATKARWVCHPCFNKARYELRKAAKVAQAAAQREQRQQSGPAGHAAEDGEQEGGEVRRCMACGSTNKRGRQWNRHPLNKDQWVCYACNGKVWTEVRRQLRQAGQPGRQGQRALPQEGANEEAGDAVHGTAAASCGAASSNADNQGDANGWGARVFRASAGAPLGQGQQQQRQHRRQRQTQRNLTWLEQEQQEQQPSGAVPDAVPSEAAAEPAVRRSKRRQQVEAEATAADGEDAPPAAAEASSPASRKRQRKQQRPGQAAEAVQAAAQQEQRQQSLLILALQATRVAASAAAGLNQELVGKFWALMDGLPDEHEARKVAGLREMLELGMYDAAVAYMGDSLRRAGR